LLGHENDTSCEGWKFEEKTSWEGWYGNTGGTPPSDGPRTSIWIDYGITHTGLTGCTIILKAKSVSLDLALKGRCSAPCNDHRGRTKHHDHGRQRKPCQAHAARSSLKNPDRRARVTRRPRFGRRGECIYRPLSVSHLSHMLPFVQARARLTLQVRSRRGPRFRLLLDRVASV
jgi:hypothetical protein